MIKRKPLLCLAVSSIVILSIAGIIFAFAGGPPTGATGSVIFNQKSCNQPGCHTGLTVNSPNGSLALVGVPASYTLGQAYDLTITVNQPNQRRWGFQLSARSRTSTASVGAFQSADGFSQLQTIAGINYIAHKATGTRAGSAGPVSFQVRWTAPAISAGEVVFSVAANAANNDDNTTGDYIHYTETSTQPPASTAAPTVTSISPDSGSVNGGTPVTITGTGFSAGASVTIGGVATTNVTVVSATQITATTGASGTPGVVDVVVTVGSQSGTLTGGFTYSSSTSTPAPTASAYILPFVVDTTSFRTNLIISNLTGTQANVTAQFVEAGGTIAGSKSYTVAGNNLNQVNRVVSDIVNVFSPTGRQGYLILESDQKIAAVVSVIDNVTVDSAVIASTRGTSGHLLFPTSVSTATFKTTMTLVNDSLSANTIELKLRPFDGGAAIIKTVNLAAYGQFHTDDAYAFLGAPSTFGPIELTSKNTSPQPFIGVSRVYSTVTVSAPTVGTGQTSSFFSAVPYGLTGSTHILPYAVDTAAFRTNLIMSNLTGTPANVTASFVEAGGVISGSKSYTVPANNLNQVNRIISDILGLASPTGRQGYLIVESDQAIAAVVSVIDNVTIDSAVIQSSRGTSGHLLLPTSVSTATFKTTLTLVNDSAATNTIEVKLRPADGGATVTKTVGLAPNGQFHADDAYSFLGAPSTFGPIELTSKNTSPQPFIGVSRVYSTVTVSAPTVGTGQTSSFFSAVPY